MRAEQAPRPAPALPARAAPLPAAPPAPGDRVALVLFLALLASLPFKPLEPLARVGGWPLTLQALLLAAAAAACLPAALSGGVRLRLSRADLFPAALLAWSAVSAAAALDRATAVKALAGTGLGVAAYHLALFLLDGPERRRAAFRVLAVSAVAAAAVGWWEVLGGEPARRALGAFKEAPTWFGNHVRAGGTFHYATLYAMYLEATLPFVAAVLGPAAVLAPVAGILLSSTRSGIFAVGAAVWLLSRASGPQPAARAWRWAAAGALAFLLAAPGRIVSRLPFAADLGLGGPVGVRFEMRGAGPRLARGEAGVVPLTLKNLGAEAWPSGTRVTRQLFALPGEKELSWEAFGLAGAAAPGARVSVDVPIRCPEAPGRYLLRYDVQLPSGRYLSTLGAPVPTHAFSVPESGPWRWESAWRDPLAQPGRLLLWRTALAMAADRPVAGVGPDGFRLAAERYSGGRVQAKVIYANNLWLDTLATTGLVGLGLLLAALGASAMAAWRRLPGGGPEGAVLLAALAAWAAHGCLDYFNWYLPLNLLFWTTLGMARAAGRDA